ncbi:Membrane protein insertase MisCB precursor [Methyloligella halotolerans]|uniref:Membrane protein insertase MisCB n=1 Tax=Methyloligella halotolerans TaxID=1177755 RepID=A0A1E2S2L4_9HYPH|nr:membrane protein insertase YidC [Methyloligella halotolerans]ODA68684.1 Membrane protein insertase MisCB precursor [Methyloligella halotolerans]
MDFLQTILWPLTALLKVVLEAFHSLLGSYGLSIICLSLLVSVVLLPISSYARKLEMRDKERLDRMAPAIAEVKANHKGQERFERIDAIYQEHGYHPIKSMVSLVPLLIQLPFLIAALFLLMDYPPIQGDPFLFLHDLGQPDHLLPLPFLEQGLNLLPLVLIGVTLLESWLRKESTAQSRRRFLIVAAVLLVLIYPAPSGVCLYWLTSTCFSFARSMIG